MIAAIAAGTVIGMDLNSEKPQNKQAPSTRNLTDRDTGSIVVLKIGDSINLTLPNYGDGGYTWVVTDKDDTLLQNTDTFNWGSSGMLGDFGKDTWLFTALETGSMTLRLECKRPFDKTDICQSFELTINIV